jgi:hypothetical protein
MQTFDNVPTMPLNKFGDMQGKRFTNPMKTHDGKWADSTGAFLVGELERLDPMMHEPLVAVSWGRDIDLREDVSMGDDATSFTKSSYASAGGLGTGNGIGNGKAWVGRNSTQITGIDVDIAKTPHPLRPWAMELKFTIFELESAAQTGRPIDSQKLEGLQLKHEMDTDEQVYYGDTGTGDVGVINNAAQVTALNFTAGALGSTAWTTKTPDEILNDFNFALTTVWANSAWSVPPSRCLIPPSQYGYIATQKVSNAGNLSILKYILENNLVTNSGKQLQIYPLKWAIGAGAGGTIGTAGIDRMVVYSKEKRYLRFPKTLMARTPIQYDAIYHKCSYYARLGVVELVYEETVGYFDGL